MPRVTQNKAEQIGATYGLTLKDRLLSELVAQANHHHGRLGTPGEFPHDAAGRLDAELHLVGLIEMELWHAENGRGSELTVALGHE